MFPRVGSAAARRGDVIRCTVIFGSKQERDDGKVRVPVVFNVNGSRIIREENEETYIDYRPETLLYPYVAFKYKNSVLAKVITTTKIWTKTVKRVT